MKKLLKIIAVFLLSILAMIFIFYVIGFALQMIGFADTVGRVGFRAALAGTQASDAAYYANLVWFIFMALSSLAIPIVIVVLIMKYFRKRRS